MLRTLLPPGQASEELLTELKKKNIRSAQQVVLSDPNLWLRDTAHPEQATALRDAAISLCCSRPVRGDHLFSRLLEAGVVLSTGIDSVDSMLDGGLMSGEITELVGPPASGKTQLCHHAALRTCTQGTGTVLYVDTNNSFSAARMAAFMHQSKDNLPENPFEVMDCVRCQGVYSIYELFSLLEGVRDHLQCSSSGSREDHLFFTHLQLIVIDSVTPLLSCLMGAPNSQGHVLMSSLAATVRQLAHDHHLVILVTNGTVQEYARSGVKAALGATWTYVPDTQLWLHAAHGRGKRRVELTKSTRLPCGLTADFTID